MPVPARALFDYHARPGAFERLAPPLERLEVVERRPGEQSATIGDGARLKFRLRKGPIGLKWAAVHEGYEEGVRFTDRQERGPFARWVHTHNCLPDEQDPSSSILEDRIDYALPGGVLGRAFGAGAASRALDRMFTFRHARTRNDLRRHADAADHPRLRVAMTGAGGLVGSALSALLTTGGHEIVPLVRREPAAHELHWDPSTGQIDAEGLEGFDAVIHLAGENVAAGRWTDRRRRAIRDSRVDGTALLARTLAGLTRPPRAFLCASAIGYYGDRGDEPIDESASPGDGFLADVVQAWEAAAEPARDAGLRVANLRIGVVISARGGALAKMLVPARLGLNGPLGHGRQVMSWVALDDVIGAFHHALFDESLSGPVNITSPNPVISRDMARTLGRVLRRPAVAPVPATALRLRFGRMADEILLTGAWVLPGRLREAGFRFDAPDLEACLRHELGRFKS